LPHRIASLRLPLQRIEEFLISIVPFNLLPEEIIKEVAKTILIEYYPKGMNILEENTEIPFFYLIYSGIVKILGEEIEYRSEGDYFGGIGLIKGEKAYNVKAIDDVVCYLIPKEIFLKLCKKYPAFEEHFKDRLKPLPYQLKKQKPSLPHLTIRLNELIKIPPVTCTENTPIITAAQNMAKNKVGSIIVVNEKGNPIGIVTKTDLTEKVIAKNLNLKAPVAQIMTTPIIGIEKNASYFEALLKMAKHNCRHLCVLDKKHFIGVISLHDLILLQGVNLITFIAEIQRQNTIEGLASLVKSMDQVISVLFNEGACPMLIMELTSEFIDHTLCRILSFLKKHSYCLIGLGELGRREQNWPFPLKLGLIYNNQKFVERLSESLKKCGFSLYEDKIFYSSFQDCKDNIKKLLNQKTIKQLYHFLDARKIAGEESFLKEIKNFLYAKKEILNLLWEQFFKIDLPIGFIRDRILFESEYLKEKLNLVETLEIIIDGVRLLSFLHQIEKTNTFERLDDLRKKGILKKETIIELKEIYNFLNIFRIKFKSDWLDPHYLSNQEKILLQDCFWSLKRFKKFIFSECGGIEESGM